MKKTVFTSAFILFLFQFSMAQTSNGLLKDAIYYEEVTGDLSKAIDIYNTIIKTQDIERNVKAKALLHLGLSHEKLGDRQAADFYKTLIKQYPDQPQLLSTAQVRLKSISQPIVEEQNLMENMQTRTKLLQRPDIYGTISSDGSHISYVNWEHGNLEVINVASGNSYPITTDGSWEGDYAYSDMSIWSPDDMNIAYLWFAKKGAELRLYNIEDKENEVIVPNNKERFPYPISWTKNHKIFINFLTFKRDKWSYYLVDPVNKEMTLIEEIIPADNPNLQGVSISPDEKYLSHTFKDGSKTWSEIHSIETSEVTSILSNIDDKPFWSEDGSSIYYTRTKFGDKSLYAADFVNGIIGKKESLVIENLPQNINHISMATAQNEAFFTNSFNQYSIKIADVDWESRSFANVNTVMENDKPLSGTSWSPDGKKFAFIASSSDLLSDTDLFIKDLITGEIKALNVHHPLLESNYILTNLHWTPDGNHILVTHLSKEEDGTEYSRMVLIDISTQQSKIIDEKINQGAVTVLSSNEFLFFDREKGIVKLNSINDSKTTIHSTTKGEEVLYITRNKALNKIAFYLSDQQSPDQFKKLLVHDLGTNSSKTVLELDKSRSFIQGASLQWVNNDTQIMVPIRDKTTKSYQYHVLDVETLKTEPIGEKFNSSLDDRLLHLSIDNRSEKILFVERSNSTNAWKISNIN